MPEQKKLAFIFDLEGVLIEHLKRQSEVTTRTLRQLGINYKVTPMHYRLRSFSQFHQTDDFLRGMIAIALFKIPIKKVHANPDIVKPYLSRLPAKGFPENRIKKEARDIFDGLRFSQGKLKTKSKRFLLSLRLLKYLKKQGHPVIVATFGAEPYAKMLLKNAKMMPYVDKLYCGNDDPKRNKDFLIGEAIKGFGLDTKRTFMVEDSLSGLQKAKKAGLKTIGVLTGNTTKAMYAAERANLDHVIRRARKGPFRKIIRRTASRRA